MLFFFSRSANLLYAFIGTQGGLNGMALVNSHAVKR